MTSPFRNRILVGTAVAALALPALAACTDSQRADAPAAASSAAEKVGSGVSSAQDAGASAVDKAKDAGASAMNKADDKMTAATSDDQVLNAIDIALEKNPNAVVINADRSDDDHHTEVDMIIDGAFKSIHVDQDGNVKDNMDDDGDDLAEDVRMAAEATVTAKEAAAQALSDHNNAYIDSIDLDDDNGRLHWDVELDDADTHADLPSVEIPAK
ncbi:Peptidase propeptide domain-containing protein [Corynebacterium mustelae]|uniref:Peptidase propeptide domain-containing protein n=1 Tax=Corynebacterium mustelae TaxID=571915 RepID=A0A0G3GXA0_9CORY|nr:PepSY domain-containing protein [Corynebacterium mustelae]AKK05801.1 Peptidase propeptide domain-containing protein [Corynebacterium mustelae]